MTTPQERWRPIPGYEGSYEASDQGRIRSVDRIVITRNGRRLRQKGRILRSANDNGYRKVALSRPGSLRTFSVHRLVMLAWVGPRPEGKEIHHIDGVRHNNAFANLEYVTAQENTAATIEADRFNSVAGHNRIDIPPEVIPYSAPCPITD